MKRWKTIDKYVKVKIPKGWKWIQADSDGKYITLIFYKQVEVKGKRSKY